MVITVLSAWVLPKLITPSNVMAFIISIILLPGIFITSLFTNSWEMIHHQNSNILILISSIVFYTILFLFVHLLMNYFKK